MKRFLFLAFLLFSFPAYAATISSAQNGVASAVTTWGTTLSGTTMTFTNASANVVGVGTLFTTELIVNDYVIGNDATWYQVLLITDDTHLVLTSVYGGTTGSPTRKLKQVPAVPTDGDKVNVYNEVTLENTYTWGDDTTTAINIQVGGKLKFSRTVNSSLTCKGELLVLATSATAYGTLDMGTSVSAIPTGVYADLILNYSAVLAAAKYGITAQNGSRVFTFGGVRTLNTSLNGAVAVGATSAILNDVTGWEVGDIVAFGATGGYGAYTQYEDRTILTIDTISKTITFSALTYAHADKAKVGNFSSNVTIKSYSSTLQSNVISLVTASNGAAASNDSMEFQYTAFRYTGGNTRGIYIYPGGRTGRVITAFAHNSFYGSKAGGNGQIYIYSFQQNNFAFDDLAFYSSTAVPFYISNGSYLFCDNSVFYNAHFTHFSSANGIGAIGGVINDCTFLSASLALYGTAIDMVFNRCGFGAISTAIIGLSAGGGNKFNNCNFGVGDGLSNIRSFSTSGNLYVFGALCNDCNFNLNSNNMIYTPSTMSVAYPTTKIVVSNKNIDPLLQEIYTPGGNFVRDNTTYKAGSASLRFDGISALVSTSVEFKVFAPTDKPITVSGYLQKNSSYGSATRPYATLSGLGITTSTYTMTDINDVWEQFTVSGTQTTGTDGMLTFTVYFQSANAGGQAWIDEVSAPTPIAVNSGGFEYWAGGQPANIITANYVAPIDVWNVLASETTLAGSMGKQNNDTRTQVENAKAMIAGG